MIFIFIQMHRKWEGVKAAKRVSRLFSPLSSAYCLLISLRDKLFLHHSNTSSSWTTSFHKSPYSSLSLWGRVEKKKKTQRARFTKFFTCTRNSFSMLNCFNFIITLFVGLWSSSTLYLSSNSFYCFKFS